jgi:DNA-binding NarL/FixJ family response regulator
MRILIADDNAPLRMALRKLIETEGWTVCGEAVDGVQAVEEARRSKPELIVLDLAMPHANGLQAAEKISQMLPGIPILLHTLYDRQVVHAEATRYGIAHVIPKSDVTVLIATIKDFAERARAPKGFAPHVYPI